ncbi:MAG: AAA family ATPase [Clostridia bacterium]|nr:AAA family ATPase [Clostridia bacterium]
MSSLYVITGPAGVGKSTISRKIAESKAKSVLLEGDDIYHQVVGGCIPAWKDGNHLEVFWKVCLSSIRIYLEAGYDVVFNYIVNPENIDLIKNEFKNYTIKFVVLMVDEKTIIARDSQRPEDCQMNNRCVVLLNSFKNKNFDSDVVLDTSELSIDKTVSAIENDDRFVIR